MTPPLSCALRSVSSVELLHAVQARIAIVNGGPPSEYGSKDAINAWVRLYPEVAEEQAHEADQRLAAEGDDAPLLCGVPIGLKDLYAVKGLPLTASSRVLGDNVADADATAWARLRTAGMVLVGHLHTHEFASGGTTDQVGNPWRTEFTASGSSGGSAAAVAARMVPVATGTDTAGSIRAPASICGVSGIKPTTGRIPLDGVIPLGPTFDTLGPLARSVADCSAVLAVMAGGAPATVAQAVPAGPLGELPLAARGGSQPLAGCTIAVTDRFAALELDGDVQAGYERAQQAVQALGARLVELPAPVKAFTLDSPEFALVLVEMWAYHQQLFPGHEELYRPQLRRTLEAAKDAMPASEYARPSAAARRLRRRLGELVRRERRGPDPRAGDPGRRLPARRRLRLHRLQPPGRHDFRLERHRPSGCRAAVWPGSRERPTDRHPADRPPRPRGGCDPGRDRPPSSASCRRCTGRVSSRAGSERESAASDAIRSRPAERAGFEPAKEVSPLTRLAGECLQPLGHLSGKRPLRASA